MFEKLLFTHELHQLSDWHYCFAIAAVILGVFAFRRVFLTLVGDDDVSWWSTGLGLLLSIAVGGGALCIGHGLALFEAWQTDAASLALTFLTIALCTTWEAEKELPFLDVVARLFQAPFTTVSVAVRVALAVAPAAAVGLVLSESGHLNAPWLLGIVTAVGCALSLFLFVLDWDEWDVVCGLIQLFFAFVGGGGEYSPPSYPSTAPTYSPPMPSHSPPTPSYQSGGYSSNTNSLPSKAQMDGAVWHHQQTYKY